MRLSELPDVRWTPSSSELADRELSEVPEQLVDLLTPVDTDGTWVEIVVKK